MAKYTKVGNTKFELYIRSGEDILDNWTRGLIDDACENVATMVLAADGADLKATRVSDPKSKIANGYKTNVSITTSIMKHKGYREGSRYAGKVHLKSASRESDYLSRILQKDTKAIKL